jgi:hypothetical protein
MKSFVFIFALSALLCFYQCNADMSPEDGVIPLWAGEYDIGTRCSCEAFEIDVSAFRSMLCYNYRFGQSLAQVTIEFNCTCFDRTHLCSLLPFSDTWIGDPDDCTAYGMNETVAFTEGAPECLDSDGSTCGILPGRRVQTQYTYTSPSEGYQYCRSDEVKFNCTTGLCTQAPIPCVVQYEGIPWLPCFVSGGACIKTRTFPIIQEPKNGAPACPAEIERTEIAECTAAECSQQPCTYSAVKSIGNCSTLCGPGVRLVTWYNVSVNSLSSCTEGDFESIINQTEIPCDFSFPCDDFGNPIQVTCISKGNTGVRFEKAEYVRVNFSSALTLEDDPSILMNSFIVSETSYGRRMGVDVNSVVIGDTYIDIYFLYNEYDNEATTGYIFNVTFKAIAGLNVTIRGNNQRVPYFQIACTDGSPPSLHAVLWYNNSETEPSLQTTLYFVFTEPVRSIEEYASMYIDVQLETTGLEADGGGVMEAQYGLYDAGYNLFSKFYSSQSFLFTGPYQDATLRAVHGTFKDMSGNVSPVPDYDPFSISIYVRAMYYMYTPDSYFGPKLLSSTFNGTIDSIFVELPFPFSPTNLLNNIKYGRIWFEEYSETSGFTPVSTVYRDVTHLKAATYIDGNSLEELATSFVVYFAGYDAIGKRFFPAPLDSVYLGITGAGMTTSPELLLQNRRLPNVGEDNEFPEWEPGDPLNLIYAFSFQPPIVLYARTYINQSLLYVTMSRWAPTPESFSVTNFNYTGINSIVNITEIVNNTVVVFKMALPYTYDMILKDVITYNGTYVGGEVDLAASEASWRYKNVTLFNGTRPAVLLFSLTYVNDSEVESSSYGFSTQSTFHTMSTVTTTPPTVANTLVINFDVAIDPATAGVTDFLITPANPLISSVTVESVTMSNNDKTATLKLSTACKGSTCFDTGPQLVSLSITGITDVFGNRITQFISSTAFDLMPPSLMSVTCITTKTCQLTFTEPVKDLQLSSIAPSPVACYPSQSAILYYEERQEVGTKFYFTPSSDIRDLSGNLVAMGEETAVKMGSNVPYKKCSSVLDLDTPAKIGFFAMVGFAGFVLVVWGVVGGFYLYKARSLTSTGKKQAVQLEQQEKKPLIQQPATSSTSKKPAGSVTSKTGVSAVNPVKT